MSESIHPAPNNLPSEAAEAMTESLTHLMGDGLIDYSSFNPDIMQSLRDGPGLVTQLVPERVAGDGQGDLVVEGQVIMTAAQRFVNQCNNFWLHFLDGDMGDLYRSRAYYDRFGLLFPDLERSARVAITAYFERRNLAPGTMPHHEEDSARFMQHVFDIMRQLIDANDLEVVEYPQQAGFWLRA